MSTDKSVRDALAALEAADASCQAPPRVERRVLEAFDGQFRGNRTTWRMVPTWVPRFIVAASLVTTLAAIVAGLTYFNPRGRVAGPAPILPPAPLSIATSPKPPDGMMLGSQSV